MLQQQLLPVLPKALYKGVAPGAAEHETLRAAGRPATGRVGQQRRVGGLIGPAQVPSRALAATSRQQQTLHFSLFSPEKNSTQEN